MEKEFVPYKLALRLKELGFDETCFGFWSKIHGLFIMNTQGKLNEEAGECLVPTFSQAFRWFREKYGLDCSFEDDIVEDDDDKEIQMWDFFIYKTRQKSDNKVIDFCSNNSNTYIESYSREEAELFCLQKLIEIVELNKKWDGLYNSGLDEPLKKW